MTFSSTSSKPSQLLDLEKYLRQQADLAKQRKQRKERKESRSEDQTVSLKKTKLLNVNLKYCKTVDKPKLKVNKRKPASEVEHIKDLNENDNSTCETETTESNRVKDSVKGSRHSRSALTLKDNTRELIEGTGNVESLNETNDSGSEYVPSDEQIDSGRYKIYFVLNGHSEHNISTFSNFYRRRRIVV